MPKCDNKTKTFRDTYKVLLSPTEDKQVLIEWHICQICFKSKTLRITDVTHCLSESPI